VLKKILQGIPGKFMGIFKRLNQSLLFKFAQCPLPGQFDCAIQLAKCLHEMPATLNPADILTVHSDSSSASSLTCMVFFSMEVAAL
jgi:hypothetical protein